MPRYIDAEQLKKKIFPCGMIADGNYAINAKAVKVAIDACPTAGVVKVVRCKDCRCWEEGGIDPITNYSFGYCRHYQWQDEENSRETNGQDYCSYGERRGEE